MEARGTTERPPFVARAPAWALGLIPLSLIAGAAALLALLGAPGLGDRTGPPVEELAIERTVLRPGEIELSVRNDGPDAVDVAQVIVNDAFVPFTASDGHRVGRLGATTLGINYPWIEGEAYEISLLTSTGGTIDHQIPVAAETPEASSSFFALMALLGLYVGVIPVALGMLWLPFVRRIGEGWIRVLIAFTVGLLVLLGVDAGLEGLEIGSAAPSAFGGQALVLLGALVAYFALSGVDSYLSTRQARSASADPAQSRASAPTGADRGGAYLALLVAIGIGLHNLGEGLAIGSAYAVGALALGTFLVIGFALHNTTEGLAIVAPLAGRAPGLKRLGALGLIAGAPAIPGAWIGFAAFNPSIAALLFGVGVGAIARVVWQLVPAMRDDQGRALHPGTVAGLVAGMLALYLTGLLVPV
ncbi:MAG: ZIP family metal transporter [Actinomycetota bacterium]